MTREQLEAGLAILRQASEFTATLVAETADAGENPFLGEPALSVDNALDDLITALEIELEDA